MTDRTKLQEELFGLQDLKYRDFHSKLQCKGENRNGSYREKIPAWNS